VRDINLVIDAASFTDAVQSEVPFKLLDRLGSSRCDLSEA
jgi:hypothetical protein